MSYQPYFLLTDIIYFFLLFICIIIIWRCRQTRFFQQIKSTLYSRKALCALMIIFAYLTVATLDSIHFTVVKSNQYFSKGRVISVLDILFEKTQAKHEKTYSKPLASHLFTAEKVMKNGIVTWVYPTLNISQARLKSSVSTTDFILRKIYMTLGCTLSLFLLVYLLTFNLRKQKPYYAWRTFYITTIILLMFASIIIFTSSDYHLLGTDKVGNDILYVSLKSVRTAVLLGSITMLIMLPFAIFFGMGAGYWGGKIDDMIQFVYTTLSAIPSVLLIIASVLALQVFIERHDTFFSTMIMRADIRLFVLCLILGLTSWTSLCRVIRAETLKLRELEYVQAAKVMGTPNLKILFRHIFPNVLHIILITVILDFSMIILAEAVLTYVGVGVDPTTYSWGNMIDAARMELARTPVVWWPLFSAFSFMFILVLAINIYVDVLRDKLDPRNS